MTLLCFSSIFTILSTNLFLFVLGTGFRDGIIDVLSVPRELQTANNLNVLTIALLLLITISATFLEDLGMVTAVGGGTLGTFAFNFATYCGCVRESAAKL